MLNVFLKEATLPAGYLPLLRRNAWYQLPSPWLGVFSNMFAETVNLGSEK